MGLTVVEMQCDFVVVVVVVVVSNQPSLIFDAILCTYSVTEVFIN